MFFRLDRISKISVTLVSLLLSSSFAHCADVDARAEVAAALYAASATQAAFERVSDTKIRAQRKEIEQLRSKVGTSAAQTANLRSELSSKEEKYVAELAERDRAYDAEISIFRGSVQDIASTPEGAAALARYNEGGEVSALTILDDINKARQKARQKRDLIEEAADIRQTATLALDARAKGKVTTDQAVARFEEVTKLDPDVSWDWVELDRLYQSAGRLSDARTAAEHAAATARSERDQEVALSEVGDVQEEQGDRAAARVSYQKSLDIGEKLADRDPGNMDWQQDLAVNYGRVGLVYVQQGNLAAALTYYGKSLSIQETLAARDPGNTDWQKDLAVSHSKVGDVQRLQRDQAAALASYQKSLDIAEKQAARDPGNMVWQRDRSVSYSKVGDVQKLQGDLVAALASYQKSLDIAEKQAARDPGNMGWQRDLIVSLAHFGTASGERSYLQRALDLALPLKKSGKLAPADVKLIDALQEALAQ